MINAAADRTAGLYEFVNETAMAGLCGLHSDGLEGGPNPLRIRPSGQAKVQNSRDREQR